MLAPASRPASEPAVGASPVRVAHVVCTLNHPPVLFVVSMALGPAHTPYQPYMWPAGLVQDPGARS